MGYGSRGGCLAWLLGVLLFFAAPISGVGSCSTERGNASPVRLGQAVARSLVEPDRERYIPVRYERRGGAMSLKRRGAMALVCLALGTLAVGAGNAKADPLNHFGTFSVRCGSDTLVLVAKPGSSNVVSINGVPTNAVTVLMGATVTVDGVVVQDFHKPYSQNHDVLTCIDLTTPPGTTAVYELLITPQGK